MRPPGSVVPSLVASSRLLSAGVKSSASSGHGWPQTRAAGKSSGCPPWEARGREGISKAKSKIPWQVPNRNHSLEPGMGTGSEAAPALS